MSKLRWNSPGSRRFETGVDRGVLYPSIGGSLSRPVYGDGVAWNGLTKVTERPTGVSASAYYVDGIKYRNDLTSEDFDLGIQAYTYPDEFALCDGTALSKNGLSFEQQPRKPFALAYRTRIGNDIRGAARGYRLHIIYNVLALPTDRAYDTMSRSPSALSFAWSGVTTPILVPGQKPTSHIIIDSTKTLPSMMTMVEDILYGTPDAEPRLPTIQELVTIFNTAMFHIVENIETGIGQLIYRPFGELEGDINEGIYTALEDSRLVETDEPGIYRLES